MMVEMMVESLVDWLVHQKELKMVALTVLKSVVSKVA
jgi:hypothetical protein